MVVQQHFLSIPSPLSVSRGNPESQRVIVLRLTEQQKFDRELGSLQSCSLIQGRETFSYIGQGIHSVLQFLNPSHHLTHGCGIPLCCCMDDSSILACLARFASSQQILLNSSISWKSLFANGPILHGRA